MKENFIVSFNRCYVEYFEDFETYEKAFEFFQSLSHSDDAFVIAIFDNINKKILHHNDFLDEEELEKEFEKFLKFNKYDYEIRRIYRKF